jgi:hypothetical protein
MRVFANLSGGAGALLRLRRYKELILNELQSRALLEGVLTNWLTGIAQRSTYLRTVEDAVEVMHIERSNTDLGEGL